MLQRTAPKPRRCSWKPCGAEFMPKSSMHKVCSSECWLAMEEGRKSRARARMERAERIATRKALEKLKTWGQWFSECKTIAQKYARMRDLLAGYGCISCGRHAESYDGGHFRSAGSAKHLALSLWNIHLQCSRPCNHDLSGNYGGFRAGLVVRRGFAFVEMIEADQRPLKPTIPYLMRYKQVIGKRANRLEKRLKERM